MSGPGQQRTPAVVTIAKTPDSGASQSSVSWRQVCAATDIPILGARVVHSKHGDIAVFRNAEDEVFALRDKCPHKGGPLSQGIVFGRRVACPLHGWTIKLDDGCAALPDEGCTVSFPVRVEEGQVFLLV